MKAGRWHILLWWVVVLAPAACADGITVPVATINRLPDMPQQRALIVYRDGVEKLVVESSFRGEGNEVAWIVPVPSAPTDVSEVPPGVFTTLELGLQPNLAAGHGTGVAFAFLLFVWGMCNLHYGRFAPFLALYWTLAAGAFVVFALVYLAHARVAGPNMAVEGVRAAEAIRVGSYDVQTLEADTSARLNEWLRANGYWTFPEEGVAIVDGYIRSGWKFVAARMRSDKGLSSPHPLLISFNAEKPVYPMRLTRLAGSDLHLDLFIASDRQVCTEGMTTKYSDRFTVEHVCPWNQHFIREVEYDVLRGLTLHAQMGLPSLVNLVGGDCVITWLQADLRNDQLDKDFVLEPTHDAPVRETVYTPGQAAASFYSSITLPAALVFAAGSVHYVRRKTRRGRVKSALAIFFIGAALVAVSWYHAQATVAVSQTISKGLERALGWGDVECIIDDDREALAAMTREEVDKYFREALKDRINPLTGAPLTFQEEPGDLVIGADERGVYIRTFGDFYRRPIGRPFENRIERKPS